MAYEGTVGAGKPIPEDEFYARFPHMKNKKVAKVDITPELAEELLNPTEENKESRDKAMEGSQKQMREQKMKAILKHMANSRKRKA